VPPFNPNGVASRLLQVSTYARPAAHDFCGCTQYRSTPDPGCVERFCWSGVLFHWNSSPDPKRVSVTFFWSPAYRSSPDRSWRCQIGSWFVSQEFFVQLGLISQSERGFQSLTSCRPHAGHNLHLHLHHRCRSPAGIPPPAWILKW